MILPKVCVLMSVYNGERYIEEQIDSILAQQKVDIELLIRDDGSHDKTIGIIKQYMERYNNISLFIGDNIGVGNSFMQVLYNSPDSYDYYAFADQDDVWETDKLSAAIELLTKTHKSLYTSNQECVDANGKTMGLRYKENQAVHIKSLAVLQDNMLAGCTFVFDKTLKMKLCEESHRPSKELLSQRIHDVWVINVAALTDDVCYDAVSHMKYRQHNNNVLGAKSRGILYDFKLKYMKVLSKEKRNGRSKLGAELYQKFDIHNDRDIFGACCNPTSLNNKCVLIKNSKKLRCYSGEAFLSLFLKILFDMF